MATRQRGRIEKLPSGRWSARWDDHGGVRRRQGGFGTKTEAGEWLDRKLDEVFRFCERVTVLRDGQTIVTLDAHKGEVTEGALIKNMVGREITNISSGESNSSRTSPSRVYFPVITFHGELNETCL